MPSKTWIPARLSSLRSTGRGCAETCWKARGRDHFIRGADDALGWHGPWAITPLEGCEVPRVRGLDRTHRLKAKVSTAHCFAGHDVIDWVPWACSLCGEWDSGAPVLLRRALGPSDEARRPGP